MFLTGMGMSISAFFQAPTMIISIPSVVVLSALILSLHGGSIRFNTPMLFALAFLPMFGIGGLTGLPPGLATTDNPTANYHGVMARWASRVVGCVLAVEVALLVFLSIPIWSARVDALPPERGSTVVRVVAEQFAWNVHYPGADGVFGRTSLSLVNPDNPLGLDRRDPAGRDDITTINRLNLPIGRPVIVYLSAKDVVHGFGLPQMRIKQDATPGVVQPVWFTPTQTGEWDIACSQLCGLGHYRMRGMYAIQSQAQFDAWPGERSDVTD